MSELRLYLRRDSFQEGADCAWSLLDDAGQLRGSGTRLDDVPRARRCRLVLAGDLVLTVKVSLPDLPERRLAPLLPAAAEAATLVEADTLHAVLMARIGAGEAVLAVVEDSWLKRVLDKLAALGLYPEGALPDYLLLPWDEGDWCVGWRGAETVARFGRAEGLCLDEGDPPVGLALALGQRARPGKLRLFQGAHAVLPDLERWRAALGLPVEAAGAWDWRTCPWPDLPDLLQGRHSRSLGRVEWSRLARPLAWGVLLLAGIQVAGTALDWGLLARESANLRRDMRNLAEQALPAHATVVEPAWQVTEQLRGLRAAAGHASPDALAGLLGRLGQAWPVAGAPRIKAVNYETGVLGVLIETPDGTWLDQLRVAGQARGLDVAVQEEPDPSRGVRLSVRPSGKEARRAQ